jgi:UDP-glucose 4-epimerase
MSLCLVTGGAGFIGSHLVEALLQAGHEVRVLDNLSTGSRANLEAVASRIEFVLGDVTDLGTVREASRGVELVFHQAALASVARSVVDPQATHQACATSTLHVLLAAREAGVRRVLYAASASAYGDSPRLPRRETDPTQPLSPYAAAKLVGEHYCAVFHHVYGLETVRLRYFNVFGPRQSPGGANPSVIPLFTEAVLAGRSPLVHGDGQQTRDFTYVADVVQANLLAAEAPRAAGKVYNIACGRRTSVLELVDRLNELAGTHLKAVHGERRPGDVRHSHADISHAQADLGYCPCTDLRSGLELCVKYLRTHPQHMNGNRPGPHTITEVRLAGGTARAVIAGRAPAEERRG